jgi:hypothetical protein
MTVHLDRHLKINAAPEYKSLYGWAINEVDGDGRILGRDQIPWTFSHYFSSTKISTIDILEIEQGFKLGDVNARLDSSLYDESVFKSRRHIVVQLRAGDSRSDEDPARKTAYRMFGTSRIIEKIQLDITMLASDDEAEYCVASGIVSYTYENDFRDHTEKDALYFDLKVKPTTFERYTSRISEGTIEHCVLRVSQVAGFYSEWSPSISTDSIKILTRNSEHRFENVGDLSFDPPRLGAVGQASLYISEAHIPGKEFRSTEMPTPEAKNTAEPRLSFSEIKPTLGVDKQLLEMTSSLKRSLNLISILLLIILVVLVKW